MRLNEITLIALFIVAVGIHTTVTWRHPVGWNSVLLWFALLLLIIFVTLRK